MERIKFTFGLILGIVCILIVGIAGWVVSSLPPTNKSLVLSGLSGPVRIEVDGAGIPGIHAQNINDAAFGLGFVHAQNRLWQMDGMRRLGAGRLSEIVGKQALPSDRFMRTLGLYRSAEQAIKGFNEDAKTHLNSYTAGVNAWLKQNRDALTLEFILLDHRPEMWKPADSVVWGKLMALRFASNFRGELLRARLSKHLSPEQIESMWPVYPDDAPLIIGPENQASLPSSQYLARLMSALPEGVGEPIGMSNSWVLAGNRTKSGKPLLANDPHLGYSAPNLWYLARLILPDREIAGATVPGVPYVVLGHNSRLAWGLTATQSDQGDLFVERSPDGAKRTYENNAKYKKFRVRQEIIKIKGAADEKLRVLQSRHGPVLPDPASGLGGFGSIPGERLSVALSAVMTQTSDTSAQALYRMNMARDKAEFLSAAKDLHAPQMNISFADIEGNIGYIAAGKVPVRRKAQGFYPRPGWTDEFDWSGFVEPDDLPQVLNPAGGKIVTANNRVIGQDYPHFLGRDWAAPYRARRIEELLAKQPKHDADSFADMQTDITSLMAADLLPIMLSMVTPNRRHETVLKRLSAWKYSMDRERLEPLIFAAWLRALNRHIYQDELGAQFGSYWRYRPRFVKNILTKDQRWCDRVDTSKTETCGDILEQSLTQALQELETRTGSADMAEWRWGALHKASFRHPLFRGIPQLSWLSDLVISSDGGNFTVKRAATRPGRNATAYNEVHGGGYRAIYDLSDLSKSRFMIATGQSGNMLSRHYRNFIEAWRDGNYFSMGSTDGGTVSSYVLRPPGN